jgi:hypothetical protein
MPRFDYLLDLRIVWLVPADTADEAPVGSNLAFARSDEPHDADESRQKRRANEEPRLQVMHFVLDDCQDQDQETRHGQNQNIAAPLDRLKFGLRLMPV